jgi:hypothetical protein
MINEVLKLINQAIDYIDKIERGEDVKDHPIEKYCEGVEKQKTEEDKSLEKMVSSLMDDIVKDIERTYAEHRLKFKHIPTLFLVDKDSGCNYYGVFNAIGIAKTFLKRGCKEALKNRIYHELIHALKYQNNPFEEIITRLYGQESIERASTEGIAYWDSNKRYPLDAERIDYIKELISRLKNNDFSRVLDLGAAYNEPESFGILVQTVVEEAYKDKKIKEGYTEEEAKKYGEKMAREFGIKISTNSTGMLGTFYKTCKMLGVKHEPDMEKLKELWNKYVKYMIDNLDSSVLSIEQIERGEKDKITRCYEELTEQYLFQNGLELTKSTGQPKTI